jgi:hypothetical protein
MGRAAIITWGIALLLVIGIAVAAVQVRSNRIAKCSRFGSVYRSLPVVPESACAQARTLEDLTLIAGALAHL